ncbi:fluoride efflux transporter FluC [Lactococcus fujiensis]|uniref:fluoride efflux transporter FluC n=1 Tax=Lactococcus fujiensis TaxID=610251 RepID=UPI000A9906C6
MNIIIVFLFGFLGGLSRYEVNLHLPQTGHFPLATLLINLLGCYLFTFLVKKLFTNKKSSSKTNFRDWNWIYWCIYDF